MIQSVSKRVLSMLLVLMMLLTMIPISTVTASAASGTLTMSAEGLQATYSGSGTWSGGGTAASGTVAGKNGFISALNSAQSATLTFTNGRDCEAYISFDYNITKNTGSVTIAGTTVTGSGSYAPDAALAAGETVQIVIKSGKGASNSTAIDLSNVSLVVDSSATTTFIAPINGSYTVNGEAITVDTALTQSSTLAYELVATPETGYNFIGWYSTAVGGYFSYDETASLNVESDTTVYPVFVSASTPIFQVGMSRYTDLTEANAAAVAGSDKQITLVKDGVLAAGTYEISAGVNLLIPFDSLYTANFSEETTCTMTTVTPTMYSCLTMAEGAVINCYGSINVNAKQRALSSNKTGHVDGAYGAIQMTAGSQINMKSGSNLYAYGFIGGDGMVWGESGSNVYQFMQIEDWRGGNDSSTLLSSLKGNSFLFSQYYLQNIETTLRIDSGCIMYGSAAIAAGLGNSKSPSQTTAAIVGKDSGMFHVTSGYALLKYDATTDRMNLDFYGDLVTDAISMSIKLTIVSSTMNTADYILALPMNYTVNIKSGSTVTFAQKVKLLPGTVVNIEQGATATINSSGAVYLYDADDWNSGTFAYNKTIFQISYVYARKGAPVTRTVTDNAVLRIDGSLTANGPVYTTKQVENGGDAVISGNGVYVSNVHGSTSLKEVVGGATTDLTTINCVPVTGVVAGHDGINSLGIGAYQSLNGNCWYQYKVTASDLTLVSGGVQDGETIYVGDTMDAPASLVLTTEQQCVSANDDVTITVDGQNFTITDISSSIIVVAKQHTPIISNPAKDPDCANNGNTAEEKCSSCGMILTPSTSIPALGHTEEIISGKAPTCTDTGLTEGKKCTVCGEITVPQEVIPANGHTEETVPGYVATCTKDGLSDGKVCTVCGVTTVEQVVIPATGHIYTSVVTDPTCTEKGYTTHTCSCGESYVDSYVDELGHTYNVVIEGTYVAPTCTQAGKASDMKCVRCDAFIVGGEIEPTGHNHSIVVEGSSKAPTCTEDGKEFDLKCANCDDVLYGAVIPATGHDAVIDVAVAPDCTNTGLTEGTHCATCNSVIIAQETVDALGHDYVDVVTAPTCTHDGYTTHTCSRCGDSYVDSYVENSGNEHSYDSQKEIYPTCTEDGYTVEVCSLCGHEMIAEDTVVPALGHNFDYAVLTPTCTTGGYTTRTCLDCDYSDVVEVTDPLGHDCVPTVTSPTCTQQGYTTHNCSRCEYTHIPADSYKSAWGHQYEYGVMSPTCLEQGYTIMTCMDCGHTYIPEDSYVDAIGHMYEGVVTTPATCTNAGVMTYTCWCGDSYTEVIPVVAHSYGEGVVTAPLCHEQGYTTYTCLECGHSYNDNFVVALGCEYGEWEVIKNATCTEDGEQKRVCIRCDHFETAVITASGHNYTSIVTNPTCTEKGYVTYICHCGYSYVDNYTDPTGHAIVIDPAVEPTCNKSGLTEGSHCANCGEVIVAQQPIAALGHTYGDWMVSKVPSCTEKGEESRFCSVCSAKDTKELAMLAHTPIVDPAKAPTYSETGLTQGSHCSACGTVLEKQEVVEKLVLTWDTFKLALSQLEAYAGEYAKNNPGKDPTKLVINFIRTGIERYTDDDWVTMAGAEETVFVNEVLAKDSNNGTIAYALREIEYLEITMPNGEKMVFDHLFGALNVSSHKNYTQSNTDFGSWAGDLCDLLLYTSYSVADSELEAMVEEITANYFGIDDFDVSGFGHDDIVADLDTYYIVNQILGGNASISSIFESYYNEDLTIRSRAAYFLNNRFAGSLTKEAVRESVYTTYKEHLLIQLLESGRGVADRDLLREACCYTFADYLYDLAKDDLVAPEVPDETPDEDPNNPDIYKVFSSKDSTIAPGVTQNISYAVDSNGDQMVFFMAKSDINRSDVNIYANYANNDASSWALAPVSEQMAAAQKKHSNPDDAANYIPNYNVVAGTNASFYNMGTGEPSGLFVMNGVTYHDLLKNMECALFAILDDGTAIITDGYGYEQYRSRVVEAVQGQKFLVRDGVNMMDPNNTNKMPRSCVGVTADGQVITVVLDGRQDPYSVGATWYEIAQIMLDAGCVNAVELDGGGSATYVAKQEGSDNPTVVNKPSDSVERSVSSSLMVVSTAIVSKEFDHAIIETPTDYITSGSSFDISLIGVGAAGNMSEIPEGAYLQLSDPTIASIDANTFKAISRGIVEIQLVYNGDVVGSKVVEVINRPDTLKFTESNLNVIYGVAEELPIAATYKNNPVTINVNDILFELSNETSGTMDGFSFIGNEESGVRNVTVTASVRTDVNINANISLRLYSSDESIFDFDNVTAGNESLAWNRVVSNTVTLDNKLYYTVDASEDVVASYTFAIDLKAISAPTRLEPLMEYLGGFAGNVGDNASPWDYLLALGARVSELTNVTITAKFPQGVNVDVSNVTFVNDFFKIDNYNFDEDTRELTIICTWNKQSDGIDPSTANSIGILSGVIVTPTSATEKNAEGYQQIDVTGGVTYDIYLDTSQLHSFAKDPENQEKYGIYDYINPNDPDDAGGHFSDTYITFEDHFEVSEGILQGWVSPTGEGMYYYVNNEMVTGICNVPDQEGTDKSYYYNFGADGVCTGKVTGLFFDETVNAYRYARHGELQKGWVMIDGEWYYFTGNCVAQTGTKKLSGVYFDFEDNGRLTSGEWANTLYGTRYYYGPSYYEKGWATIDGVDYCFKKGYVLKGLGSFYDKINGEIYYDFGPDGSTATRLDGIYMYDGQLRYFENGKATEKHLIKYGDDYYYTIYNGVIITNKTLTTASTNCDLPKGQYTFGPDGKMIGSSADGEIVELDGTLYYYEKGKPVEKGLVKVDGDYYFSVYKGKIITDKLAYAYMTSCDLPKGNYEFGADGKMLQGIVDKDGVLYYYENGRGVEKGLVKYNDDYYFTLYQGKVLTNKVYNTYMTSCDLPNDRYEFGADGKMLQGIVEKDGVLYYYENGKGVEKGLFKLDGNYYFSVYQGKIVANKVAYAYMTCCDLPKGNYEFGADGKMLQGIVEKDGVLYYYENGKGVEKGLFKYDGNYYFAAYQGKLAVDKIYSAYMTSCDLPKGNYEFGADGKMLNGVVTKDGVLYYYENGKGVEKGLFKYDGNYYFAAYKGKLAVDQTYNAYMTSCDLPKGTYTFGADGKALNGIYETDGALYYYENGAATERGLFKYNGDYYYAAYKGKLVTSRSYKAVITSCDLPLDTYEFGADGKMLNGIIDKDGVLYYYENGKGVEKGLFLYEGHYYFSVYKGKLVTNRQFNVYQGNGLLIEQVYTFNELGQIVA